MLARRLSFLLLVITIVFPLSGYSKQVNVLKLHAAEGLEIFDASVEVAPNGGFITVWQEGARDPAPNGPFLTTLYAERFDANGQSVSSRVKVNSVNTQPVLINKMSTTSNDSNNTVIAWYGPGETLYGIHFRVIDQNGLPVGDPVYVGCKQACDILDNVSVAINNSGQIVLAWVEKVSMVGTSVCNCYRAITQAFDTMGNSLTGMLFVNLQSIPDVFPLMVDEWVQVVTTGEGDYAYIWSTETLADFKDDISDVADVVFRTISNTWSFGPLETLGTGEALHIPDSKMVALANGEFVAFWYSTSGDSMMKMQRVSAGGQLIGEAALLPRPIGEFAVSSDTVNNIVVVRNGNDISGHKYLGRQYNVNGEPHNNEFTINKLFQDIYEPASVSMNKNGRFATTIVTDDNFGKFVELQVKSYEGFDHVSKSNDGDSGGGSFGSFLIALLLGISGFRKFRWKHPGKKMAKK